MRNERTPRTLAETSFTTGHRSSTPNSTGYGVAWWLAIVAISAVAGYLIATGVPA